MKIIPHKSILVIRVNDFKEYSFIKEHRDILLTNGSVSMLKAGRPLAEKSISKVMDDGAIMLLKASKKTGGKYYASHIKNVQTGSASDNSDYPQYYLELQKSGISLNGTWLQLDEITEVSDEAIGEFRLVKGGKLMSDIVSCTRSPILFVQTERTLIEKDGLMVVEK